MLMRYAVKLKVLSGMVYHLLVKDNCEQSGVNTIESLKGFHPSLTAEFWPPFITATFNFYTILYKTHFAFCELKNFNFIRQSEE